MGIFVIKQISQGKMLWEEFFVRHWFAFLSVLDFAAVQELLNLLYFTLILALFVLNNVRDFFWRFLPAALAA